MSAKKEIWATLRYAGAFIAWVIGSGFATGQEILQFFSSYGQGCALVLLLCLAGFIGLGVILIVHGYDHREEEDFHPYRYYCGRILGKCYAVIIPVTLVMLVAVLLSAAGATLEQYFSLNRYLGAVLMAALILTVYLIGFEKMVRVLSAVSPLVILFVMFVGAYTVFRDAPSVSSLDTAYAATEPFRSSPGWFVSGLLYLSINFLTGSVYYTELGRKAESRRAAKYGAILGAVVLLATIGFMAYAILLNGEGASSVSVPTLYLAERISHVFGSVFSVVLMLGMFASCAATLWSFCSGFFREDPKKNRLFSAGVIAACLLLGLLPFGKLVSVIYPIIGYFGLLFVAGVLSAPIRNRKK